MIGLDFGFGPLQDDFFRWMFLMTRIGAALVAAPFFGMLNIPVQVRVITAPPYYPAWKIDRAYRGLRYRREMRHAVDVMRAPLWVPEHPSGVKRLLHLASFAVTSLGWLARQVAWRPDVVFTVEPPLFCSPATLLFARLTGAKAWLHIQDYEVDAAFKLALAAYNLIRMPRLLEATA